MQERVAAARLGLQRWELPRHLERLAHGGDQLRTTSAELFERGLEPLVDELERRGDEVLQLGVVEWVPLDGHVPRQPSSLGRSLRTSRAWAA